MGLPSTLIQTDRNNFSPRVGFAWRLDENNRTVLRGGFGLFHPTVAVQGVRDLLATNEFRYGNAVRGSTLAHGFSTGTSSVDPQDYGSEGIDPNLKSPDIYQYNLTLSASCRAASACASSYIGSTMRNLLVTRFFNDLPASTNEFHNDFENFPEEFLRLPLYPRT